MHFRIPIIVVPAVTKLAPDRTGSVVVGGSHAAIFSVSLVVQSGARAAILHDAGIGKDEAGIAGLAWGDRYGMAVAAVAARSARIGDGQDMLVQGVVSRANRVALECGVTTGMSVSEAAKRLCVAPLPSHRPRPVEQIRSVHAAIGAGRRIVCLDSIALAQWQDRGQVVACGSHGGAPSALYTTEIRPYLTFFNDAFPAAQGSGVAALALLDDEGVAAAAVSSSSARIGDGQSTLHDGVVSTINAGAAALGVREGDAALTLALRVATSALAASGPSP